MANATPERCLRIRLLLDLEGERGIRGRVETRPGARPAPTTWLDCPTCNGTGRQGACSRCDGQGVRLVDPYTSGHDVEGIRADNGQKLPRLAATDEQRETMDLYEIDRVLARLAEQALERGETDRRLTADVPQSTGEPYRSREIRRVLHAMQTGPNVLADLHDAILAVHWPSLHCLACNGRGQRRRTDEPGDVSICRTCLGAGRPTASKRVQALEELGVHWIAMQYRGQVDLPPDAEQAVVDWRRTAA